MENYMPISPKAARVNARISATKAAEKLGVSLATLMNYEAGRTSPPWDIVEQMGALYNWPITAISFIYQSTKRKRARTASRVKKHLHGLGMDAADADHQRRPREDQSQPAREQKRSAG